jgi:hypothetical protein
MADARSLDAHSGAFGFPHCLKCDKPMQLLFDEEHYFGYSRQTFGCQTCDGIMTEWSGGQRQVRRPNRS